MFARFCSRAAIACMLLVGPALPVRPEPAPAALQPGLSVRLHSLREQPGRIVPLAPNPPANAVSIALESRLTTASLTDPEAGPATLVEVRGQLHVDRTGEYAFEVDASGPARLSVGPGGWSAEGDAVRSVRRLAAGTHEFRVDALLSGAPATRMLNLRWKPPGSEAFGSIPADRLRTAIAGTPPIAPGFRTLLRDLRPGDRTPLADVHPGWDLLPVRTDPPLNAVGSAASLPDGRLVIGRPTPSHGAEAGDAGAGRLAPGRLHAVVRPEGGPRDLHRVVPISDELENPSALCFHDGGLYVAQPDRLLRLTDPDGDGFFDRQEAVASGWAFAKRLDDSRTPDHALLLRGGKLWLAVHARPTDRERAGGRTATEAEGPLAGTLLEIDPADDHRVRAFASGLRPLGGLGIGPGNALICTAARSGATRAGVLLKVKPGRFHGHADDAPPSAEPAGASPRPMFPSPFAGEPGVEPSVWLPQDPSGGIPSNPLRLEHGRFAGQLLVGDASTGRLRRVFLETIGGTTQGAVFRFSRGPRSGVRHILRETDGSLCLAGAELHRMRPNGNAPFEMESVRATPDGFEVRYTQPVERSFLSDPANFRLRRWRSGSGGDPGGSATAAAPLRVQASVPDATGTSVRLVVPEATPGHVVHLVADPTSVDGEAIWSTEAWYTLRAKPVASAPESIVLDGASHPVGPIGVGADAPAGAVTLLGRGHLAGWNRGDARRPSGNLTQDDLRRLPHEAEMIPAGGDLVTRTLHGDARFHVEWLSPSGGVGQLGGNSGVYLQGLFELQVLNTAGGEAVPEANEAGALYDLRRPDVNASLGPDVWQSYDIWFRAARFEGGVRVAPARVTVLWNGRLVHEDVALHKPTGSAARHRETLGPAGVAVGPLKLQSHASAAIGPVRYRNVWVAPLEPASFRSGPWKPLFDGHSLAGWRSLGGEAGFAVENGVIVGTTRPDTADTFLCSESRHADFELELEARIDPELDSGVRFRSRAVPDAGDRTARVRGPELELDATDRAWSGGLCGADGRGWIAPLTANPAARAAFRRGGWNRVRIRAAGGRIETWINDIPAVVVLDDGTREGRIGLQVSSVGPRTEPLQARWRNIRIRELVPEPAVSEVPLNP